MGLVKFNGVGIKALCAAVPSQVVRTIEQTSFFDKRKLENFVSMTGIYERRIAPSGVCASDLCFHAANRLINDFCVNTREIGTLIFVSQTPDYREPATSIVIQNKLGLSTDVYTVDVNQACSGYIWGLFLAYSLSLCHQRGGGGLTFCYLSVILRLSYHP
jgi:3-oxoacyl-[acyl-carrier-protein] synthase-3